MITLYVVINCKHFNVFLIEKEIFGLVILDFRVLHITLNLIVFEEQSVIGEKIVTEIFGN